MLMQKILHQPRSCKSPLNSGTSSVNTHRKSRRNCSYKPSTMPIKSLTKPHRSTLYVYVECQQTLIWLLCFYYNQILPLRHRGKILKNCIYQVICLSRPFQDMSRWSTWLCLSRDLPFLRTPSL